jgi:hypothetical protein
MLGAWRAGRAGIGVAVATTLLAGLGLAACGNVEPPEQIAGSTCVGSTNAAGLNNLFDQSPGGMFAADYQRAVPLPDGRTLWLFQDASIMLPPPPAPVEPITPPPGSPPAPPATRLVHNAALIQNGTCFDLLRSGTDAEPRPWLFPNETAPFSHWFWPLDATMGQDGRLYIFVAEMVERGPLYLSTTEPIATRVVAVDPVTMTPVAEGNAPNASAALYGFSITSDATWTYLYSQCHRQFGWSPSVLLLAHDLSCSANVTVARVPKGQVLQTPTYWDGTTWQLDASRARAVIPTTGRSVNPSQVRWTGSEFVAVTKVGDWFGTTVFLDRAPAAQGPWTTYARVRVNPKCDPNVCNTYFASWVPFNVSGGQWMIGLSNNRWDGRISEINRPTFLTVPPPGQFALAARCSRVQC